MKPLHKLMKLMMKFVMSIMIIAYEVYYLVTLFLKKMIMIQRRTSTVRSMIQVMKSPLHLNWMMTTRLYLKIQSLKFFMIRILHALHLMTNIWKVGMLMISLKPIFLKRNVMIIRRMKIVRDLVPVMNTLSYLT